MADTNLAQDGAPRQFRLGLCLAGAVSGGAYTAGALDFIVEALDAWEKARQTGDALAPPHRTVLHSVASASSGSLTTAALAAVLRYAFPPVHADTPDDQAARNPLFDSWVNMTDISDLLATRDASRHGFVSLLDATRLDEASCKAVGAGDGLPVLDRPWLADPVRLNFTVSNLRGVPLVMQNTAPPLVPQITLQADVLRFALYARASEPPAGGFPDERALVYPLRPGDKRVLWKAFSQAALASAAFPAALPVRTVARPLADYDRIDFPLPGGGGTGRFAPPWAEPGQATPGTFTFAGADGGVFDNDPVDLVRADLNGRRVDAHNERDGRRSSAAVLMIHALLHRPEPAQAPKPGADRWSLPELALGFARAVWNQSQISPAQIALALEPDVYSRFLIAPTRSGAPNSQSATQIAGGSLGGFGGYLSRTFRLHDYQLGRRNAQQFLAEQLTLKPDNPLFDHWTAAQRRHFTLNAAGELPIIPLLGRLDPRQHPEPLPDWPYGEAQVDTLAPLLQRRLDHVAQGALRSLLPGWGPGPVLLRWLGWRVWRCRFSQRAREAGRAWAQASLEAHKLAG
jgi:hypothetical protein